VMLDSRGREVDKIVLEGVGQPRSYGQAILFGPGGHLFIPITTAGSPDEGAVRSYDVTTKTFVNFEAPATLGQGWFLTFGNTDPATLAYSDPMGPSAAAPLAASSATPPGPSTPAVVTVAAAPTPSSGAASSPGMASTHDSSSTTGDDPLFGAWANDLLGAAL